MVMVLEHQKLPPILLMMLHSLKLTLMVTTKLMQELKVKPYGQMYFREPTHLVMQFKMAKEIHLLILGQKLLPQQKNTI